MEETNLNEQKLLNPYKLAKRLQVCDTEREALASQVEELKGHLQSAKIEGANREEKTKEQAAKLEDQNQEIQSVRQLVEEMKVALQSARRENDALRREVQEAAIRDPNQGIKNELPHQLNRLIEELEEEKILRYTVMGAEEKASKKGKRLQKLNDFLNNENKKKYNEVVKELQELEAAYKAEKDKTAALQQALTIQTQEHRMNIQYEAELRYEKEKNDTLQKHLKQENRFHAEKALVDLDLIRKLRAANNHLRKQMEDVIQALQKTASERETSLKTDVEDHRSQVKEVASLNPELKSNTKAEEVGTQDIQKKTANLKVEVLEQAEQPAPDPHALELTTEVDVHGEEHPTITKKPMRWKKFCCFVGITKKKKNCEESNS